jgi:NTE family protein
MLAPEINTGLILTGGGARAAYQVGVLKAISRLRREFQGRGPSPFQVITGTSAGAINATLLACRADEFDLAVAGLVRHWKHIYTEQIYRSDSIGILRTGASWLTMMSIGWMISRWRLVAPRSLLDNAPLRGLLAEMIPLDRLQEVMDQGHLKALAISASSYGSGFHVTFYDAVSNVAPWSRSQRLAIKDRITIEHLMASSAIPFVFPAISLSVGARLEYFGDGSMRQSAPISPAVHLGAQRILVIGAGRMHEPPSPPEGRAGSGEYPTVAQIAGHAMSSIFLDTLAVDVERLQRINKTLSLLPKEALSQTSLRPIDILVIAPSMRLDDIAARHLASLPRTVRALLGGVGVSGQGREARGAALASYLLFEAPFTQELMSLGESDTLARREEINGFFGWKRP